MTRIAFAAALLASAMTMIVPASSQARPDESKRIQPTTVLVQQKAVVRTPEQMDAFDATFVRPSTQHESPFARPTMDAATYQQMKHPTQQTSKPGADGSSSPVPPASIVKFTGASYCDGTGGCWYPPDVAGTIGKSNWVSVSNDVIEIRSRGGVLQKINSLNGFFGYSAQPMFDPRVQYDEEYQRWVITADAFQESASVQYMGVAVSTTSSATGTWYIYFTNTASFTGNAFWDYPMLGLSQDAAIFTANVFGANFQGSYLFAVAKARIYNGYGWSVPVYGGLNATLQPARQLAQDQSAYSWLAAAVGSGVNMYAYFDAANPGNSALYGPISVSGIAAYSGPPAAAQPAACGSGTLDSLDGRFQNQGTQDGDVYYQTHTVGAGTFAIPKLYQISGLLSFAPAATINNYYYASASSQDFNPSIGVDNQGHFALNWSSTDPGTGRPASMYYTDNRTGTPSGVTGFNVFTGTCWSGSGTSRWGDYSQTSVDWGTGNVFNTATKPFWITNEYFNSTSGAWSTEVAKVPY
jgi:hypothetical protein